VAGLFLDSSGRHAQIGRLLPIASPVKFGATSLNSSNGVGRGSHIPKDKLIWLIMPPKMPPRWRRTPTSHQKSTALGRRTVAVTLASNVRCAAIVGTTGFLFSASARQPIDGLLRLLRLLSDVHGRLPVHAGREGSWKFRIVELSTLALLA